MITTVSSMITSTTTSFGAYLNVLKLVQTTFSTLINFSKNLYYIYDYKCQLIYKATITGFGKVTSTAKTTQNTLSSMSTSVSSYMSSMSSKVGSFGSASQTAFGKTKSSADSATKAVKALQSAINALKNKTVTITQKFTTSGTRYVRQGGSFISMDPTGFAAGGKTFINSKPRKIGGVNVSEFGKPELVTVTPLSNPMDPMDKNISMNIPMPKPGPIPSALSPISGGGGRGGNGQPITVTGNLNVTVKTANGKVLAQEVQPYLFEGFSGVT